MNDWIILNRRQDRGLEANLRSIELSGPGPLAPELGDKLAVSAENLETTEEIIFAVKCQGIIYEAVSRIWPRRKNADPEYNEIRIQGVSNV